MFTFETRFNPYYLVFIVTRENSKKTKREQYKFSCLAGTLELLLDSYEYHKRDAKGYYYTSRGWYRYPASKIPKETSILDKEEIPTPSSLHHELMDYVASCIKFAPFKGLKSLEKKRAEEQKTVEKHWKKVKKKVKADMEAKEAETKAHLKRLKKEAKKAKEKAKEKKSGKTKRK